MPNAYTDVIPKLFHFSIICRTRL